MSLPLWANKTCEGCVFNIRGCCRRAITNYGYVRVESAGQYRPACSFHQEVSCASEEEGNEERNRPAGRQSKAKNKDA